jgi:glycosyltransferase involved in cell wall biosynthesis
LKPLLTVAIPTYNRPSSLSHTLDVLCGCISDKFEILICDDSSDERVQDLVGRYQQRIPKLRYVRNPTNLGFNANVAKLYELSTTPYVWFLCDDDTIFESSVSNIIMSLEKHNPAVCIFNCSWNNAYNVKSFTEIKEDRLYINLATFDSYQVLMRMTFLSILVFQKHDGLIEKIKKGQYFNDNVYVQLTLGLLILSENFRLCESAQNILHRNVGYRYGEFCKFILLDFLKAVYDQSNAFDNKKFISWSIKNWYKNVLLLLSQKIGLFQYEGKTTVESKVLLKKYYGNYYYCIVFIKISLELVPSILVRFAYFCRLLTIYGIKDCFAVYKKQINRSITDQRETKFTTYK